MAKILILLTLLITGIFFNNQRENVNTIMEISKEYRIKLQNEKSDTTRQTKIIPPQIQSSDQ
jgi:hypothetical protein